MIQSFPLNFDKKEFDWINGNFIYTFKVIMWLNIGMAQRK